MKDAVKEKIIYTFDTWEDYDDFMQYVEGKGIIWANEEKPTEFQKLKYIHDDATDMFVLLVRGVLQYGGIWNLKYSPYKDYEKVHWGKKKDKKVIYTFDTWEDFDDLMQYLEDEGVVWPSGVRPTESDWLKIRGVEANQLAVRLAKGDLYYASKKWYQDSPIFKDFETNHWKKREEKDTISVYSLDSEEDTICDFNKNKYSIEEIQEILCKHGEFEYTYVTDDGTKFKNVANMIIFTKYIKDAYKTNELCVAYEDYDINGVVTISRIVDIKISD